MLLPVTALVKMALSDQFEKFAVLIWVESLTQRLNKEEKRKVAGDFFPPFLGKLLSLCLVA